MTVEGLNHINIVARDMDATARFYAEVLGMEVDTRPGVPANYKGCWISDTAGRPIVHVQQHNPERHGPVEDHLQRMGALDHVALSCSGFDEVRARCEELGVPTRINDGNYGLRQIFVTDPDGVVLELNFGPD
jgi:catechol 2,3-dioxygenase-like lactoylglutathione lyase family enzyme